MQPEKLVLKYIKVRALAQQGNGGERTAAKKILGQMEMDHPGIQQAVAQYEAQQRAHQAQAQAAAHPQPNAQPAAAPAGVWAKEGTNGNWENLFRYAKTAFEGVYGFAEQAAQVMLGAALAQKVETRFKYGTRRDVLYLTFTWPREVYLALPRLNTLQQQAFKEAMRAKLDQHLDALFEPRE